MTAMQRSNAVLPSSYVVSYDQELSTGETNVFLSSICRVLLDGLSPEGWTAAGNFIADCLTSGDFPSLVLYDPDVLDLPASDVFIIRQCLACFSKRVDIDIGVDRQGAARAKARRAEIACRDTNRRFQSWQAGRFTFSPLVESVLHGAQRKIVKLLSDEGLLDPCPSDFRPRFGPGATTQVPKKNACLGLKLNDVPACTTYQDDCYPSLVTKLLGQHGAAAFRQAMAVVDLAIHNGKVAYVSKNAKEDRPTETQPGFAGIWQLGIGDRLGKALRRVGIDIRDQSANQRAAMYGSISGALATLDLSSASDTIAVKLVEHLFPGQWFDLFTFFRTNSVQEGDGVPYLLSKFSGMGNGFTFPLETTIFWAITASVVDILGVHNRRVLVYGDDIIVDSTAAPVVASVLEELGFTINKTKSFWSGRFRESCGADFILGTNVRPCYVDGPLTGADFFRLHNFFAERKLWPCAKACEVVLHPSIRTRGPKGYGDGHLHSDFWISKPVKKGRRQDGWAGYHFETWTHSVRQLKGKIRASFVERDLKDGRIVYRPKSFALVKAIATYTVDSLGSERWWDPARTTRRGVRYPETRGSLRDLAISFTQGVSAEASTWAIPGPGVLRRTRVYTFETPIA